MAKTQPSKAEGYTLVAECLYRSNESGIYYGLFKRNGKQIRRSLRTVSRALAERKLLQLRQKVRGLASNRDKAFQTFAQVGATWLAAWKGHLKASSLERRQLALRQLCKTLGQVPIRNVTPNRCELWAGERNPTVAAYTFNLERDTLHLVLEYARREGLIMDNPAEVIQRRKQTKAVIVIPSQNELAELLDWLRTAASNGKQVRLWPQAADFIELLALSGMRLAEANAFCPADVDFERGVFTVTGGEVGTKNNEARIVPLFPALRAFLLRLREREHRPERKPWVPVLNVKKSLGRVCLILGFPNFTHHCFRHYFVSNALEKGVDFKTVAAWIGHKDGGMLVARTYGHLRDTHSFEMASRMV